MRRARAIEVTGWVATAAAVATPVVAALVAPEMAGHHRLMLGILAGTIVGLTVNVALAGRWLTAADRSRSSRRSVAARVATLAAGVGVLGGVVIALLGDSSLFASWWRGFADAYGGDPTTRAEAVTYLAPVGAVVLAHYTFLGALLLKWPGPAVGRLGAWSIVAWFTVDSTASVVAGAPFNVVLINLPAIVVTLPAFVWLARARA